jgi:hypothetical protein
MLLSLRLLFLLTTTTSTSIRLRIIEATKEIHLEEFELPLDEKCL